jgi:hypothetical protein
MSTAGLIVPSPAAQLVQRAREEGRNVAEFVGQGEMFGEGVTPETEDILRIFFCGEQFTKPRGGEKISAALRFYLEQASKTQPEKDIFGAEPATPGELLKVTRGRLEREEKPGKQSDLFGRQGGPGAAAGEHAPPPGQDRQRPERPARGEAGGDTRPEEAAQREEEVTAETAEQTEEPAKVAEQKPAEAEPTPEATGAAEERRTAESSDWLDGDEDLRRTLLAISEGLRWASS